MEVTLSKVHLQSLVAQVRREWIIPSAILALTDEQIERLGVCGCFAKTSKKAVPGPPLAVEM